MRTVAPIPAELEFTPAQALLRSSLSGISSYAQDLVPLRKAIRIAAKLGNKEEKKIAARFGARLDALEPSVTMIGQIKSGKTTLVNCMIGCPDLLPADVNPWTSVVTSLHLSSQPLTPPTSAKFSFFEEEEWDHLIAGGGRIGELADRAGADDELAKIKAQVNQMRDKSKARLGRNFEALLGQNHDYGYFDKELVERYVCLGDNFDDRVSEEQGRFADITRLAELRFHQPAMPMNMCIRDTPGVNDTFLMREQITIRSIRDSRICVVVLSAHQALSSTDLALIRLISNIKAKDIIIFVNRIDELSDPAEQVPQVSESLLKTLKKHGGPVKAQLVFGSALWAHSAISSEVLALPEASKDALISWAKVSKDPELRNKKARIILWQLSGLPDLYAAIAERVQEGVGQELVQKLSPGLRNLINAIQVRDNLSTKASIAQLKVHDTEDQLVVKMDTLCVILRARLLDELKIVSDNFNARLERVHDNFLSRATQALILHLERYGEREVWEYDPSGLRILVGSSYSLFGKKSQNVYDAVAADMGKEISDLYQETLHLPDELFEVKVPPAPRVPPPVTLGQTMALDLKGNWWKSWWFRRRGYQSYASDFYDMIQRETMTLLLDVKTSQVNGLHQTIIEQFDEFLDEQKDLFTRLMQNSVLTSGNIDDLFDRRTLEKRDAELRRAHALLDKYTS